MCVSSAVCNFRSDRHVVSSQKAKREVECLKTASPGYPSTRPMFRPLLLLALLAFSAAAIAADAPKPNVLFIAVDDLNHWVGHLGRNPQTKTPNLDRLATMGVTFTNAHCAAPVCNPSRAALLSGKRPGVTGIYDNGEPFAKVLKPEDSLVTQFKNAGYDTLGMGKLWHGGLGLPEQWTTTGGRSAAATRQREGR